MLYVPAILVGMVALYIVWRIVDRLTDASANPSVTSQAFGIIVAVIVLAAAGYAGYATYGMSAFMDEMGTTLGEVSRTLNEASQPF